MDLFDKYVYSKKCDTNSAFHLIDPKAEQNNCRKNRQEPLKIKSKVSAGA